MVLPVYPMRENPVVYVLQHNSLICHIRIELTNWNPSESMENTQILKFPVFAAPSSPRLNRDGFSTSAFHRIHSM
ncbi:hypothetical protein SCLCIDRAFT_190391 [Scleroderma citrinum Foug A]|uniref:Uncharacterized protein n=1 Tax=Scleroderma citrinum Foug A TaxID=1036808 RepID=A0A0C3DLJ3_9AGAM|nr:hypothetical protein SCLCIDRAFT_190391 [Scleroderma citrinum Foug A]